MNKKILLVDDELKIRILLSDFLTKEGFSVMEAKDGMEALELFSQEREKIDLILLDVMLPSVDGWTVCREIRKKSEVPIIMLTARGEDFDEIHGFEIGADDYVKKPISPGVLTARIQAFFRRRDSEGNDTKVQVFQNLEINDTNHTVRVEEQVIELSPKEYGILMYLIENKNKVISREKLIHAVWGYDFLGETKTVNTHMNRLRDKLGEAGKMIHTIRGYGYKFGE